VSLEIRREDRWRRVLHRQTSELCCREVNSHEKEVAMKRCAALLS
jgi:hypothetical protein